MADKTEITTEDVATVSAVFADDVHPMVGLPDGHVDHNNEKIVYERDEAGEVVGWHKEPVE